MFSRIGHPELLPVPPETLACSSSGSVLEGLSRHSRGPYNMGKFRAWAEYAD